MLTSKHIGSPRSLSWLGIALVAALVFASVSNLSARPVMAAGPTCTVNAGGDATYTTIQAAVNDIGCTTIQIQTVAGVHHEHDILVDHNVTIVGSGGVTNTEVNGDGLGRVFNIAAGAKVTINNLRISQGGGLPFQDGGDILNSGELTLQDCIIDRGSAFYGGGLSNHGRVTLTRCLIENNNAFSGGAIFQSDPSLSGAVMMTITRSTIAYNSGSFEPGIYGNGSLLIVNSTIAANSQAARTNPANTTPIVSSQIEVAATGVATIVNSTVMGDRSANQLPNDQSNVIINSGGAITLTNSIVAADAASAALGTPACTGTITNGGNNLSSDATCGTTNVADPKLDPAGPQTNGGSTPTIALLPNSPAINAASNAVCAAAPVNSIDQRGITRPQGTTCDIGAYEFTGTPVTPTPTATATNTPVPPTPTATSTPQSTDITFPVSVYSAASTTSTYTPLAGWEIKVYDLSRNEALVKTSVTGNDGILLLSLPPGPYKVCETLQANWQNFYPVTDVSNGTCYRQMVSPALQVLMFLNRYVGGPTPTPINTPQPPTPTATATGPAPTPTSTPAPSACTSLGRTSWYPASSYTGTVSLGIDASKTTFWNNGITYQGQGHWFSIDLGSVRDVSGITLDNSADAANYPRNFDVLTSIDGGTFTTAASATPIGAVTHLDFARRPARWVVVLLTRSYFAAGWSIGDFDVCNSPSAALAPANVTTTVVHNLLQTVPADTGAPKRVFLPAVFE